MKGHPEVVEILNQCLTAELTAINQYYVHSKMCAHWGYPHLAKQKMDEAEGERRRSEGTVRATIKWVSVLVPPIPAVLIGEQEEDVRWRRRSGAGHGS